MASMTYYVALAFTRSEKTGITVTVHSIAPLGDVMGQAGDDEPSEAGRHFPASVCRAHGNRMHCQRNS